MIINYIKSLSKVESSGKKIGIFRIACAIFGGLLAAYLSMIFLALLIPKPVEETAVVSIMLNTLSWACFSTYIALAASKLSALLRFILPSIFFALYIFIYKGA